MPEFIPQHTPKEAQGFLKGYLQAMEWLAPDLSPDNETPIGEVRGFTEQAVTKAAEECLAFETENEELLAEYCENYEPSHGYSLDECAGHDFYLSRNRHGSGFWDRGEHSCFQALDAAAEKCGESEAVLGDDGFLHISP